MAEPKTVRVRQDRKCCYCGGCIQKGTHAEFLTGRSPKFDKDGVQRGIYYWKYWAHYNNATCDRIMSENGNQIPN